MGVEAFSGCEEAFAADALFMAYSNGKAEDVRACVSVSANSTSRHIHVCTPFLAFHRSSCNCSVHQSHTVDSCTSSETASYTHTCCAVQGCLPPAGHCARAPGGQAASRRPGAAGAPGALACVVCVDVLAVLAAVLACGGAWRSGCLWATWSRRHARCVVPCCSWPGLVPSGAHALFHYHPIDCSTRVHTLSHAGKGPDGGRRRRRGGEQRRGAHVICNVAPL